MNENTEFEDLDPIDESSDDEPQRVAVELTETECAILQHVLSNTAAWNRQEGDDALARRHGNLRNTFIDAHEKFLQEER